MANPRGNFRYGRSLWPMILFLVGCGALIILVSNYYLIPAIEAATNADTDQKRQLGAVSRLLLSVVLFIVFAGIVLVFRVRRFFYPQSGRTPEKTEYIDAWAESGRRANVAPRESDDEEDPDDAE